MKISENKLKKIVRESIDNVMGESVDENAIIDKIGVEVEPLYKTLVKLSYIYEEYANKNSFLGSVVKDVIEAKDRLEHLIYIVKH